MLSEKLKKYGVVGAGGAGFPTYVKAESKVEYVIANGAECEPLIHKDFELMKEYPSEIVEGMKLMMDSTGAKKGKFGIKEKHLEAIEKLEPVIKKNKIDFSFFGDFYPSGDEYEVVYTATGRLIPPAGIPLQIGCVVNNVETLYNIFLANQEIPITHKIMSVSGVVNEPKTFWIPVGTSFRDLIEIAGGSKVRDFGVFDSGIMMGNLSFDLDDVVTKTTAGLIILPREHFLITRKSQPIENMNRIGKSACDQCSYCTEFCPRYLLGYEVEPHKVMRSLGFTLTGADNWNQWAELCCACGLCTLYACPEDLFPKEACDEAKIDMRSAGIKFIQQKEVKVHPMKEHRRVPQKQLRKRLKVDEYEVDTPFEKIDFSPKMVRIKLQQHIGKKAEPVVTEGERVDAGQVIATVGEKELGANIHSSIDGRVTEVNHTFIAIEKF
ncbi:MAG: 4Fe-4S dicluster domain-containing protein [Bacteroidetes bacterium]|nr:4Fe-4S dicluster domain-containing protein [Bacteroidota bacterium]MBU2584902.1 4Fe-4S dicluster domain-containing protein [Bacteroidota bacterium]